MLTPTTTNYNLNDENNLAELRYLAAKHNIIDDPVYGRVLDLNGEFVQAQLEEGTKQGKYTAPCCGKENGLAIDPYNGTAFLILCGCGATYGDIRSILTGGHQTNSSPISAREMEAARLRREKAIEDEILSLNSEIDLNDKFYIRLSQNQDGIFNKAKRLIAGREHMTSLIAETSDTFTCKINSDTKPLIAFVTRSAQGYFNGAQVWNDDDGSKKWFLGEAITSHKARIRETNESPLTVTMPPLDGVKIKTREQFLSQEKELATKTIYISESACHKPHIAACRLNSIVIGIATWTTKLIDLKRSIEFIQSLVPDKKLDIQLLPDAGSIANPHVMNAYSNAYIALKSIGHELTVKWWEQEDKEEDYDVDEVDLDELTHAEIISFDNLVQKSVRLIGANPLEKKLQSVNKINEKEQNIEGRDKKEYDKLTKCLTKPLIAYNEEFLPSIAVFPNEITFVSSPCGTGKTYQLKQLIDRHEKKYPDGSVITMIHRRSLKGNLELTLDIADYKTSEKDWNRSTQTGKMVTCIDSIVKYINPDNIKENTLVLIDEGEAVLEHTSKSSTLGNRITKTQKTFSKIIGNTLAKNGSVVVLEDNITDLCINNYNKLTLLTNNEEKGSNLIVNKAQKYRWDIRITSKGKNKFWGLVLERLNEGKRVFMPTSSKNQAEIMDELTGKLNNPEWLDKTLIIHSDTAADNREFLKDPNSYLKNNDIRLLVCSPTIESGFSINDEQMELFDYRMGYFVNNSTRSQVQSLYRLRSNCPTDVFVSKRAQGNIRAYKNHLKEAEKNDRLAKEAIAKNDIVINETDLSKAWNKMAAMFTSRDKLATDNAYEFLRDDLSARGHNVTEVEEIECHDSWRDTVKTMKEGMREKIDLDKSDKTAQINIDGIEVKEALQKLNEGNLSLDDKLKYSKVILLDNYPAIDGSNILEIYNLMIKDGGKYARQSEMLWMAKNPSIANKIEQDSAFAAISDGENHYSNLTIKHTGKIAKLLNVIIADIETLIDKNEEYTSDTNEIITIAEYARSNRWKFRELIGINIYDISEDKNGKKLNTNVETANKIIRSLGYAISSRVSRIGKNHTERSYCIVNSECIYRDKIFASLNMKHQDTDTKDYKTLIELINICVKAFNSEDPQTEYNRSRLTNDTLKYIGDDIIKQLAIHLDPKYQALI